MIHSCGNDVATQHEGIEIGFLRFKKRAAECPGGNVSDSTDNSGAECTLVIAFCYDVA